MTGPLRTLWDAPAASPSPPRRVWRDWALVAVFAPLTVLEAVLRPDLPWVWLSMIVTLAGIPALLWRRTYPLLTLCVVYGTTAVLSVITSPSNQFYSSIIFILFAYSVFRWGTGKAAIIGLVLMLASLTASTMFNSESIGDVIGGLAVVIATVAFAVVFRSRASARERELDQAKLLEREQLARDLHDTVAHHVSAIAIQAQAGLATAANNPLAAAEALRIIEREASRTLAEMRTMVRVLRRHEGADLAPSPQITDLHQLAGSEHGGPVVAVKVSGDVDGIPPTVAAAIYRIAQESVTNARRHSRHATRIEVLVEANLTEVRLSVRDDGESPAVSTPGYGITGMTERAALLGGSFTAGRGVRGWLVTAVLPRKGWI